MRATFDLDPCHKLEVTGDVPRTEFDPASVCLNLLREPLPVPVYAEHPSLRTFLNFLETEVEATLGVGLNARQELAKRFRDVVAKRLQEAIGNPVVYGDGPAAHLFGVPTHWKPCDLACTSAADPEPTYRQPPTETMLSVSLRPSHARAIASAILSAATEAKR